VNPITGVKRILRRMLFRDSNWQSWRVPWGRADWTKEVGDPMESSIIAAIMGWVARTFPEAPPMLERLGADGIDVKVLDHPMLRLLQKPNPHYTGVELWMATVVDWAANGDAYWYVIPSASGDPVELWWMPSWTMNPVGTPDVYLDHYDYTVNGKTTMLDPRYVVHFRYGLDPQNDRKGLSQLKSLLREVFTDNEAATFTAAILRNMGVPGVIVSPDSAGATIDEDEAKDTKEAITANFTGVRRGEPMVMTGATKVQQFGFNPQQLMLKELRRVPEERASAVTGIPAIVVGFGAGLDRSTFTNMGEAKQTAYEAALIPMQRILAEKIRFDLLPLWVGEDPFLSRFSFDLTKVRVFQEDLYRLAQRVDLAFRGGWMMRSEARRALNLSVDEKRDNVFLLPARSALLGGEGDTVIATSTPPPAGTAAIANGNGHVDAAEDEPPLDAREIADEVLAGLERRELTQGAAV
jgi:HK97 family phage portal protein